MNFHFQQTPARTLISLTPLIDVVFILLLFFMLASNFDQQSNLSLQAGGSNAMTSDTPPPLRLRVLGDERYELDAIASNGINDNAMTIDRQTLQTTLESLKSAEPELAVSIGMSDTTRVQALLDIVAMVDRMGIARVTLEAPQP